MDSFDAGLKMRMKVLGEAHVKRSLGEVDDFNRDLQQIVTGFAWGQIWTRPGLSLRERSILNLGMLTALNRPHEFKVHVRGALNNGLTRDEIREVLIQTAVYCGFPAAIEAFRLAREVFKDIDGKA
ncbi:MAG TPA: carboxymuconolactone decarboxylase family protein [Stellaceae bacterium]|jgi:4-carboxymuconolactone decarboxylase|nr:carboxymuconolactone decarboxylase family protein [Stellaceae bacterium]